MKNGIQTSVLCLFTCLFVVMLLLGGGRFVETEKSVTHEEAPLLLHESVLSAAMPPVNGMESGFYELNSTESQGERILSTAEPESVQLSVVECDANGNILVCRERYQEVVYRAFAPENGFV